MNKRYPTRFLLGVKGIFFQIYYWTSRFVTFSQLVVPGNLVGSWEAQKAQPSTLTKRLAGFGEMDMLSLARAPGRCVISISMIN